MVVDLKESEKRILSLLQSKPGQWFTRPDVARALGRNRIIHPNDIAALERLTALGIVEAEVQRRGIAASRWAYRVKG